MPGVGSVSFRFGGSGSAQLETNKNGLRGEFYSKPLENKRLN